MYIIPLHMLLKDLKDEDIIKVNIITNIITTISAFVISFIGFFAFSDAKIIFKENGAIGDFDRSFYMFVAALVMTFVCVLYAVFKSTITKHLLSKLFLIIVVANFIWVKIYTSSNIVADNIHGWFWNDIADFGLLVGYLIVLLVLFGIQNQKRRRELR